MRAALLLLAVLLAPTAQAHLPSASGDNTRPETAQEVDPALPQAVHTTLQPAQARYWRIELAEGQRVTVSLFIPPTAEGFRPRLVVLAPGPGPDPVPDVVQAPPGYGARLLEPGPAGPAQLDPVVPSVYRTLRSAEVGASAAGTLYVVVFEYAAGPFGLAFGAGERATFTDWAALPARRAAVYEWEGQPWWLAQGPAWAAGAIGLAALLWSWRGRARPSPLEVAGSVGGLLMLASAPLLAAQLAWSLARSDPTVDLLAIGVLVAAAPAVVGATAIVLSRRDPARVTPRWRAALSLTGLAGFAAFAGFGLAPWAVVLAGLLPADRL